MKGKKEYKVMVFVLVIVVFLRQAHNFLPETGDGMVLDFSHITYRCFWVNLKYFLYQEFRSEGSATY